MLAGGLGTNLTLQMLQVLFGCYNASKSRETQAIYTSSIGLKRGSPIVLDISERRRKLVRELVGEPVPRLWCPPLTHYAPDEEVDQDRMAAHWDFMAPHVNAFLVPGSTGDAWEMNDSEVRVLIDLSLRLAVEKNISLLLGVLKSDASATRKGISELLSTLKWKTGKNDSLEAMKASNVCGFTICPPRGHELTQEKIEVDLASVLELGLPMVLYQLPQVTDNEMSPSLVARLADRYENLVLLKDSSGVDRVAMEANGRSLLFLLRGAEGRYAQWLQESGGPYHGLLLSTANCFPRELRTIVALLEDGRGDEAINFSDHLTQVVEQVFALVRDMTDGNAFSNANKAVDHYMAFGADARLIRSPRLHAGTLIPEDVILRVGEVLESAHLIPDTGYLNQ